MLPDPTLQPPPTRPVSPPPGSAAGEPLPAAYDRMLRAWVMLGVVAFSAVVVVFWLMVTKPS